MLTTEFLITSLVVVLIPGTGVIYTVSAGLFGGRKASVAAALGCTCGIIPHLLASILGLSLLLHTSAVAFQMVKWVFMGMTLFIFILYVLFAYGVRAYVVSSPRIVLILQRSFAGIFAMLGAKLALTDR